MSNGAVTSFIEGMKSQPLALALAVISLGLLGLLYYNGKAAHDERAEETRLMYEQRADMAKLLQTCNPQPEAK